jgi:hypothetical protein
MPDSRRHSAPRKIVTASAQRLTDFPGTPRNLFQYSSWQEEAWDFWRNLGELNNGIAWLANSLSRVRLYAAEAMPGGDEPAPLEEGPASDLMAAFAGGTTGQSMIMGGFGYQLGVPGEGWLVCEREDESIPLELATWRFMPTSAVRNQNGKTQIRVGENMWRPIAGDAFATKIFREDPQFPWKAWSPVQAALPILRRIDLVDRRIVAVMVSRLAMNGLLLIPQEGEIEVPERFKDAANPFFAMMLEAAATNIKAPGSASAAIPLLVKYAAELIDKWRVITWPDLLPPELLEEREKEVMRLARTLQMPVEALTGMGDINHWSAWALSEEGIKLWICPPAEVISHGVTVGYLYPLLDQLGEKLLGPNGGKILVWYDVSELAARPDKSKQALDLYDRLELNGTALRRESGLDESDKPENEDLADQIMKFLARQPQTASAALAALTGKTLQTPASGTPVNGPDGGAGLPAEQESGAQQQTMPATLGESPPAPDGNASLQAGVRIGRPSPRPRTSPRVFNGVR